MKSVFVTMKQMIAVVFLGVLVTTSAVLVPAEPVHADIVSDVVDKVVGPIKGAITRIKNTIVSAVNAVFDAVKEVQGFLTDLVTLIIGLDPNDLHSFVVANLTEDACKDLPDVVNNLGNGTLPDFPSLPLIGDLVSFSGLRVDAPDIIGIDPSNADGEDLFQFKTRTNLPLATLKGMAKYPYTIPLGISFAFSSFCVEATERHLAMNEDVDKLRNQIHHDLASGKDHTNALNQLPEEQGGFLEDVRFVVFETISLFEEAGEGPEEKPLRELAKGDDAFAEGSFREAYKHYQKAYSAATLDTGSDDDR